MRTRLGCRRYLAQPLSVAKNARCQERHHGILSLGPLEKILAGRAAGDGRRRRRGGLKLGVQARARRHSPGGETEHTSQHCLETQKRGNVLQLNTTSRRSRRRFCQMLFPTSNPSGTFAEVAFLHYCSPLTTLAPKRPVLLATPIGTIRGPKFRSTPKHYAKTHDSS